MPKVLHTYRSNRVEVLADRAAELCARPPDGAGPLEREVVVVQGRGMAVWFSLEMSRRLGVFAGAEFLYPKNFVQRLFERVLGTGTADAYHARRLTWTLLSLLREHGHLRELAPLSRYVAGDDTHLRSFQLARRIADTFDQYLTYRPDWVRAWERGEDVAIESERDRWQPVLWRLVTERLGVAHTARLERALLERLASDAPIEGLPKRVVVFGVASLPPMHARALVALAQRCEVHWFLPTPATGYWADFASPERVARAGERAAALHLDAGHPLLTSLGRLGAELSVVLAAELEALEVAESEPAGDLFVEPPEATLLGRLQRDILHAEVRLTPPTASALAEPSVALHACHGPMREVEVLHDQLLDLVTGEGVAPHEIVVMMPDVDAYAPLIEAVFEREPRDPRFVPYRISDRHLRRDSPVVDAFLRLLALSGGRVPVSAVLDLLALAPVARRFEIAPEEVDTLRRWIADSGIRWGIDEAHKAAHGQPPVRTHSWRFGLERLLLGYAMPSEGRELFTGVLAYDEIEGKDAELLGKLATFAEQLFAVMDALGRPGTVGAFSATLGAALDAMVALDAETAWEHRSLRTVLAAAAQAAEEAGFDGEVSVEVMRSLLEELVEEVEPARGFLAGGVTFCAMVPMRNLPFRVVCLLGLSDAAFPRSQRPLDFDLMGRGGARRPGDRSRRDDDRYLFLEALLAARERLLVFYTGQSIRDGSTLAPSVVVTELCDAIAAAHPGRDILAEVVTRHPLQPFSRRYFDGSEPRLFSYADAYCAAAQRLLDGGAAAPAPAPLFDGVLDVVEGSGRAVALSELLRFFESPVRYLLNRRLGVDLSEEEAEVLDREPVELGPLDRWAVGDRLLELRLAGVGHEEIEALARAEGLLPIGTLGALEHQAVLETVEPLVVRVRSLREGGPALDLPVSRRLPSGVLLSGEVGDRWARGQLRHQFSRVSGKHLLTLWIRHLVLSWQAPEPSDSYLVGRAPAGAKHTLAAFRLRPVEAPARHLEVFVDLFERGMREPLPFFPQAALTYARGLVAGKDEPSALAAARTQFLKERERDAHVRRVFDADALTEGGELGFAALSREVMLPLLEALEDL